MIKYTPSLHRFSPDNFEGFCEGWAKPLSPQQLYTVLQKSYAVNVAYLPQTLQPIGFVNAISDGTLSAYIPLLEVLPAYRKQGVGSQLVSLMLQRLEHLYMVDLCCDPQLEAFYTPLGFTAVKGMVRRNYSSSQQAIH